MKQQKNLNYKGVIQTQDRLEGVVTWSVLLSIFLLLVYLLTLPTQLIGYALAVTALTVSLIGVNRETLAVFFLLIGPPILGIIFQTIGVESVGSIISITIGFILVAFFKKTRQYFQNVNWLSPFLWLFISMLVLLFFYFEGPKSEYSNLKITWFVINVIINTAAINLMITARINLWRLSQVFVAASVSYLAAILYLNPGIVPTSIWVTAGVRLAIRDIGSSGAGIPTNGISILASFGIALVIGSIVDIKLKKYYLFFTTLIVFSGLVVLNSIGQRLFLFSTFLAVFFLRFCNPKNKKLFSLIIVLSISLISAITVINLQLGNAFIDSVFDSNLEFDARINRSINWSSAIDLILEKPWLGHGLGGYYISGYSAPGEGTYAHNLFLELLSETGIIGTSIIIVPAILFFVMAGRKIYMLRTASMGSPTAFFLVVFAHAMVSHDLKQSAMLFALIAVLWARLGVGFTLKRQIE